MLENAGVVITLATPGSLIIKFRTIVVELTSFCKLAKQCNYIHWLLFNFNAGRLFLHLLHLVTMGGGTLWSEFLRKLTHSGTNRSEMVTN